MGKILLIEIDEGSEEQMIKSLVEDKMVQLNGKVIEAHRNMDSYKKHTKEEYSEQKE